MGRLLSENFIRRVLNRGTVDYEIIDSIPSSSEHLICERRNHPETPVGTLLVGLSGEQASIECTFLH